MQTSVFIMHKTISVVRYTTLGEENGNYEEAIYTCKIHVFISKSEPLPIHLK